MVQHCLKFKLHSNQYHVKLWNVLTYFYVFPFLSVRLWWFFLESTTIELRWNSVFALNLWILASNHKHHWEGYCNQESVDFDCCFHDVMSLWVKICSYFTDEGNLFSSESSRKPCYKSGYPMAKMVWLCLFSLSQDTATNKFEILKQNYFGYFSFR